MLEIKNNRIYINRGETGSLDLKVWNKDGTPFILPPVSQRSLWPLAKVHGEYRHKAYDFYEPLLMTGTLQVKLSGSGSAELYVYSSNHNIESIGIQATGNEVVVPHNAVSIVAIKCSNCELEYIRIGNTKYDANKPVHTSVLVFTVRAGDNDSIVLCKCLNLNSNLVVNNELDHMTYGWNKFTSQQIISGGSVGALEETLLMTQRSGNVHVGEYGGDYYQLIMNDAGNIYLRPYEFNIAIPFLHSDTHDLQNGEYTYDVIVYQGIIEDPAVFESDEFPFKEENILWKLELIEPNKFIVGGSHNA